MGIAAAVQPIKKGFLADFNQPATAHHRKPRCVYQLISTGSGNSHDMLNIRNIQNQGQRVLIIPLHFFFHIGVPPLFKFFDISFSAYLPFYLFRFLHAALLDIHESPISRCARPPFQERSWRFISVQTVIQLSRYTME